MKPWPLAADADVEITVRLTRREADELLRADAPWSRESDGRQCIQRELSSAGQKIRDAIDNATRPCAST